MCHKPITDRDGSRRRGARCPPAPGPSSRRVSLPRPKRGRRIIAVHRGRRYALLVSQPEIQRQQRGDIDALYELVERVERVDQKVDALDVKVDRRFDEISGQLTEVLRQLRDR